MTRKGKVQLQSEITTNLADNTSRDISAEDVRNVVTNITDSMIFPGSGVVADFASSEIWPVANGGTGSSSASGARTNLGLVISTNVQAYDAQLDTFAALTANQVGGLVDLATLEAPASDGQFIVATGAGVFAYESTGTARTSLGLGTVATLDTGISNTNVAKFTTGVADDDFLRVDGTAIEGRSASEVLTDIAASPVAGSSSIVTVGTVTTGTWQGTAIVATYIADSFLKNDASDTTTGTITAGGFTTTGTWTFDTSAGGTTGITNINVGSAFTDDDVTLMSAGAIKEKIENYGYTTNAGDMTGVDLTGGTGISIDSETNTASGAYSSTITCNLEGTELISTGETGASKFLREDGDGTCSWQTVSGGGGISFDGSTANGVLTYKDSDEATVEANLTYDGTDLLVTSSSDGKPVLTLKTTHTTKTSSGELQFLKDAADTEDGEVLGQITFYGEDEGNNNTAFSKIVAEISESDETDEAGKLSFYVAESDGTTTALAAGLVLEGEHATNGEVDVTIGAGTASTTIIAGTLTMGSTAALTNAGLVAVANQSNITGTGALSSGSIASGFGNITTTGTIDISGGTLTVAADGISGDKIHGGTISGNVALGDGATATTQSSSNNSTKIATTAYADAAGGGGSSRSVAGDTGNGIITWVTGDNTFAAEANFTYDGTDAIITSATSAKPILTIQNTNDDATSGTIKFNKNTGDSAAAADVLGNIDFAGEDADENAHTYARILAKTDDPTSGGEEGSIEFHVAENDGTLTKGMDIVGLGSDGNITVDISTHDGAAGGLKLGGTLVTSTATEINVLDALTRGSLVYGNASAATAELAVGAANRALTTDGTDVSWTTITNAMLAGSIDLTSKVTGTLPVGNGGTGLTSISTLLNSNVTPTSLSLLIGTNTQAYDAQLDTLAALTANQVGGLVDLATLEAPASDGQFIVATGAGAFAYESGATARTSLGVDVAGTDNSTNVTLVTSSHDYLSISTQAITLGAIDLAADVTGTLPVGSVSTITLGTNTAGNYVATVTGGTGITSTGATSGESIAHSLSVDASQTQITAVGTLVGLTLDGDKNITPGDGSMVHLDTSTLTDNNTSGSSTAAKFASVAFEAPTLAATNSSVTTTDATTVYISAAPSAGTNQTLTRSWALWIDAGNLRYDGSVYAGTTEALNSSGLVTVANQSNITGVSTITSGVWNGTAVALAYGGTGLVGATDGKIVVADGSGAPVAVQALTANDGYVKHEVGGIEADISAVAIGDILAGTGTGAIGVVASSGASDGHVLTIQADGTAAWEAAAGGGASSLNGLSDVTYSSGDLTITSLDTIICGALVIDSSGAISLDSGTGILNFQDSGSTVLSLTEGNSGDVTVKLETNGKDLVFTDNGDATNMKILDAAAGINVPGEVQTTKIAYTDGDDAITIADGGAVTFAKSINQGINNAEAEPENAVIDIDLSKGNYFHVTLGAAVTDIDFTNGKDGQRFLIRFTQAAGANYAIAYDAVTHDQDGGGSPAGVTIKWAGGIEHAMTRTNAKADTIGFIINDENAFDGFIVGQNI